MGSPAIVNLPHYQGDRLEVFFRIRTKVWDDAQGKYIDGPYMNLTGLTLKGHVKVSKTDPTPEAAFSFAISDQETTPGGFLAYILPSETSTWTQDKYLYDIQIESDADHIDTYIAGTITVTPEVTKNA